MCFLCDGGTPEEAAARLAERVRRGWCILGVEAAVPWSYTVGLVENFAHPELVVVGLDVDAGYLLLDRLAAEVRDGTTFAVGDLKLIDDFMARFGAVHERQAEAALAQWAQHYWNSDRFGVVPEFEALQVCMPEHLFCSCHAHLQTALSSRDDALHATGNRAQRRARARKRGNRR